MQFDILSLGDHVPAPGKGQYLETQAERFALWVKMGRIGEALGFRGIQFGEHHDSDYIVSAPQMILAAIAAQTETIKLGTGVSLLANLDAVRFAEDFATLDLISQGRAEVGFGTGIEDSVFKLFGQDPKDRNALIAENLDLLQKLWSEDEVTWEGKFRAPLHSFRLQPKTVSCRPIPIARGTGSLDTATKIGEAGHQLLLPTMLGQFKSLKGANDAYRTAYRNAGHDPRNMCASGVAYVYVGSETARSREYFEPQRVLDLAFCRVAAEVARDRLGASEAVGGLERMTCMFDIGGLPADDVLESIERFSTEVIPIVRNEFAGKKLTKEASFA